MTYAEREESVYEGNPIELYQFTRDDGTIWRYTSSDSDKIYLGNIYTAIPVQRNAIEISQDIFRATLEIEMPSTIDFIQQFVTEPLFLRIAVVVFRYHLDNDEVVLLWTGRVINVEQKGESTGKILCESAYSSLKRPSLRRLYGASCPHVLYKTICKVDESLYEENATITNIDGLDITSPTYGGFADGYFLGGYVELTKDGEFTKRFITNHVGSVITVNLPLYSAELGDILVSYPGCDHTLDTCFNKFNNVLNYGGQPWIPDRNPMGGVSIF